MGTTHDSSLPLFKVFMAPEAPEAVAQVLQSGYITQGPKVEEFEKSMQKFLQNEYTLTTNSATSATYIALHLLKKPKGSWPGLQPGDQVLSTALTCTATNWPILANGLDIKWVDVDPATANICPKDLRAKITARTKVITFVHWGGTPVELDAISAIQDYAYER